LLTLFILLVAWISLTPFLLPTLFSSSQPLIAFPVVYFELTVMTFFYKFCFFFSFLTLRLSVSAISRYFTDVIYLSKIPYNPSANRERYSQFVSVHQLFPIGTSLFALGLHLFATIWCLLAGLVCTLSVLFFASV